jgi:aconitase A
MYLASPYTVAASAVAGYIVEYEPNGKEAAPSGAGTEKQIRRQ